jgi:hypothetical protein
MLYFEVYYLGRKEEEFFHLSSDKPFPVINVNETVYIDGVKYGVYKKEHYRSKTEISTSYYVNGIK